ncbi:MAG: MFS transporter [Dehalococcoidia bacterium]|nr:MFS transporter [Dehalococcoidia bacterium]
MADFREPPPLKDGDWGVITPTEPRVTTFSSLGNRNYRWFWLSMLASFGALHMELIARNWLAWEMTHSALALGMVAAAWGLPVLLLTLYGGAVTDRVKKRNLLIVTLAINMLITLVVAVLITTGVIVLWHLILAAFTTGVTFAFNAPGRQSFIPELVPKRQLMNAIALYSTSSSLLRVIGYTLGGILIGAIGVDMVYYIVVGCYITAAGFLAMISISGKPVERARTSVRADLVEGLRYIWHSPLILSLLALEFIPVLIALPFMNLMPIFADMFQRGSQGLGFLMGAVGAGSLIGALTIASLGDFKRKGPLLLVLALGFGVMLALFGISNSYPLSLALLVGVGIGSSGYFAVNNTLIQSNITNEVRGRVMGIYMMTFALMPLGTFLLGAVVEEIGASLTVAGSGAIVVIFVLAMAILRPTLRRLD